jgi:hypothetical protein
MTSTTKFETGKTYQTRSIGDWDCIHSFTILARTGRTITTTVHGEKVQRRINTVDGVEQFKPFGSYSMAAVIRADKQAA